MPGYADPAWWKAASYDLHELKRQGVPDDDGRVENILVSAGEATSTIFQVGVEYRMVPTPEEAKRLVSISESRKNVR